MRRPSATRLIGGLLGGATLAAVGIWAGTATAAPATTPVTTTIPGPESELPESRFGPTVVVAEGFDDAGGFLFRYRLDPLGGPADHPVVVPEHWRLRLTDGTEIESRVTHADARSVRFTPDDGSEIDAADVAEVAVTGWRIQTPMRYGIELDTGGANRVTLDDGTEIAVLRTIVQTTGTLVQFDFSLSPDRFNPGELGGAPVFFGEGPEWRGAETVRGGGGWRPQLDYLGESLPDPFVLQVRSNSWQPLPAEVIVDISEMP